MYSSTQITKLINRYLDKGGEYVTVEEGCLGWGFLILRGEGLKYAVVKERFVTAWSSTHTVRMYNKLPKKYERLIHIAEELQDNVKEAYVSAYPDDDLGAEIGEGVTFQQVWDVLRTEPEYVYNTMGVFDSLIRERVFDMLSHKLGVKYEVVYNTWLAEYKSAAN